MKAFFVDAQTTGAGPHRGQLLELAWGFENAIESRVVKIEGGIPRRIQILTGISDKETEAGVEASQLASEFHSFLRANPDAVAVIHYAKFEIPFLKVLLEVEELPFQVVCTHELARRVVPQLPSRGLKGLAGYFGFKNAETKRARSHVEATIMVWRGLCEKVGGVEGALKCLSEAAPKRGAYEYPIEKVKRLDLPAKPGVYRFLSRHGEVLYVGKATSLKDRVNSYFRGRKGRDHRKLEMLTQAHDFSYVECANIIEASMLESDLIKDLRPPYNVALKSENKSLMFYSPDFLSARMSPDRDHPMGPYSAFSALGQLYLFCEAVRAGVMTADIFYDPVELSVVEEGYRLFRELNCFSEGDCRYPRRLLAFGMWKWREILRDRRAEADVDAVDSDSIGDDEVSDNIEAEVTPENIAERLLGICASAAADYLRAKKIAKLSGKSVSWSEGCINVPAVDEWNVRIYDRLSVLYSEILKGQRKGLRFNIDAL